MLLIPAIDLKDGKCVRLRQGRQDEVTVFSNNPVDVAVRWANAGAKRLHIIDLDGAASGAPKNMRLLERIAKRLPQMPIQFGGGVRDEDTMEACLNCGAQLVILGTRAVSQPHFVNDLCLEFPGHVIIALDVRDGKVATEGWSKLSHHEPIDLARHFETDGVATIIHTDIKRDGMLTGANVKSTVALASAIHIPVIAAGGYAALKDIEAICTTNEEGIQGVILGRALYENMLDFSKACELADRLCPPPDHASGQTHNPVS